MTLKQLKPRKALNKAFLKLKPNRADIDTFKKHLIQLLDRMNDRESEEFHKNLVSDFLKETYYKERHFINTKGRNDLVIHNTNSAAGSVGVIIEAKKPTNYSEMLTPANINVKAFHELVLYYMRERIDGKNLEIRYLIATNINEWFVFDANIFERCFAQNKEFVKQYNEFKDRRLAGTNTDFFYTEIAKPFIDRLGCEIEYTWFDIRDYDEPLRNDDPADDNKLIALYKLLSPEHLLKLPFANDSNTLDKRFYGEMLHIIGLTETKEGSKKIIGRSKEGQRNAGSLLENAIIEIDSLDKIIRLEKPGQFGSTMPERLFNVALELCITWMNRILFLKLLEAQLITYHRGDKSYSFLNLDRIQNYDDLNSLFFKVLARKFEDRNSAIGATFSKVPYLNSSLFEPTELEHTTLFISNLSDDKQLPIYGATVLKDQQGRRRTGTLSTLEYLFDFLSAYDFTSEGSEEIQEDNKTLINASVLGLIFEKINGYKDGSFFTPGFITMYMCRETIRMAVVQKFNEVKGWSCETMTEIYNKCENRDEANRIVNSLKICDPAVGSGHFLVSALNEIIAVKNDLKILQDRAGKRLKEYHVEVENDELIVTDDDGIIFEYNPKSHESQRVQEALFHEKQTIIENCLFGVDINPNSVKICRLRLWIELLKNAYYKNPTELETLPNIDINIKCGNSLISRFALDADLGQALKKSKWTIDSYRLAVATYRNAENKEQKREMRRLIADIKSDFRSEIARNDPKLKRLQKVNGELFGLTNQTTLFEQSKKEKEAWNKKVNKLADEIKKLEAEIEAIKNNKIYEHSFEWRFEFPEVLNEEGDFTGFDVVIGNPPYIKEYENRDAFNGLRNLECYQGKMDIWYLFGDFGLKLLKPDGYLCYIATNNWVTNAGASNFRNIIIKNSKILNLTDFGAYMIFENASIQTMIMLFKNSRTSDNYSFDYRRLEGDKLILQDVLNLLDGTEKSNSLSPFITKSALIDKPLTFNTAENSGLLEKIKSKQNFVLREKADKKNKLQSELGQGIVAPQDFVNKASAEKLNGSVSIGDGIFVLSQSEFESRKFLVEEKEIIKPYFTTEQLQKYYGSSENTHWLIYTKSDINKIDKLTGKVQLDNYPKIKQHLEYFKNVITSDFAPYGLHRAREQHLFEGRKIMVTRKCPKEPIFTYTDFDCFVSQTFFVIQSNRIDLKYLTGLLNSKLIAFWLRKKGKMQGNSYQLDKEPLLEIPIFKPADKDKNEIANLIDTIISLKQQGKDSSKEEKEIDDLIYQLYDLTEEEIKIVEESVS